MVRRVFFSFHYERDVWRANQVRNSWVTKPDRDSAGFLDAADFESLERQGDSAVKRWIDSQLKGTSVTVILIGKKTSSRKWVRYEIKKSLEKRNKIFGVRIHKLKNQNQESDSAGDLNFGLIDGENTFSDLFRVYDWVDDTGYKNFADWVENSDSSADENNGFWGAIAALAIAVGFGAAISSWFKPRCRYCNFKITKGVSICPNCGRYIN